MEMRMKRKVAAGAAALLAVAGGGAAIAATQLSPKQESQTVLNDAARDLGVSPSDLSAALKSALAKRIDAAVAAGHLTKDQADELKQRLESGDFPLFGAPGDQVKMATDRPEEALGPLKPAELGSGKQAAVD